ncbi:Berardinelli-Seip congenital lipodystrophy 2 (seipin) [Lobosporangium transversale]|uniref:Putative adipose-regulatory protein-domain-containing protein n=1 Tax=Lobosporangium transversale TaxID=64571 RepID=A0A1Y2GKC7_9FUNG|nr:putative adipose-regulatory protein-domain-containing protein [Lobosporangium transversale]KAF9906488.1 Berardinelli-Seip congenital lipodystrophy 2 (seipin) [Lobosporangium transversale]ORZ13436.1 putative adipose-regulatory protein-domain-containing protein [Lobosporangium transversale]|eukprot:XP_021880517.1 putative adipose-regulatory protein-domain-containing protein [Lobosporangium transversale]
MTLFEASLSILSFFITPLLAVLDPYVKQLTQWLTSSALHRKIIKFFVGLIVLLLLVGVSLFAYLSFYWVYIPQRGHVGQVHLQYDRPTLPGIVPSPPSAEVDFSRGGRYTQFLRADQAYDISVNLHVPTSEKNVAIGNFMVVVTLLRVDGTAIMTSSRPAILTYQSLPLKLMRTAWRAVPLVLEWSKEDQVLRVPLVENYVEDAVNPVARARVEISSPDLQVYKTTIHIDAHFHGLRYFMYYYKVSTALVFMAVFIFWEIIFSVITWQVLAGWFGSDSEALAIAHQMRTGPGVQGTQPGQLGEQQQLLRGHPEMGSATPIFPSGTTPRQPQVQIQRQKANTESDNEFEEEELGRTSRGVARDLIFDHDEMEDDEDQALEDDAVVPERPQTPLQRRHEAGAGIGDASLLGSRSTRETTERQQRSIPTTIPITTTTAATTQRQHRGTVVETDDGASTSGSTTTTESSRRIVRGGIDMSMTTSSSLHPPPPPPPSLLSERSSEFQMSQSRGDNGGRRRAAVESEYTEEDDEYVAEEADDDDDDDDDGNISFGEEDFTEASLLSRSPVSSRPVRLRRESQGRVGAQTTRTTDNTGRSTARAGQ